MSTTYNQIYSDYIWHNLFSNGAADYNDKALV